MLTAERGGAWQTDWPDQVCVPLQFLYANAYLKLGRNPFDPHPFRFIIY